MLSGFRGFRNFTRKKPTNNEPIFEKPMSHYFRYSSVIKGCWTCSFSLLMYIVWKSQQSANLSPNSHNVSSGIMFKQMLRLFSPRMSIQCNGLPQVGMSNSVYVPIMWSLAWIYLLGDEDIGFICDKILHDEVIRYLREWRLCNYFECSVLLFLNVAVCDGMQALFSRGAFDGGNSLSIFFWRTASIQPLVAKFRIFS